MQKMMGIVIENRGTKAPDIQGILTEYGCMINSRIGFHESDQKNCSNEGFIILKFVSNADKIKELESRLNKIRGVRSKYLEI